MNIIDITLLSSTFSNRVKDHIIDNVHKCYKLKFECFLENYIFYIILLNFNKTFNVRDHNN